MNPPIKEKFVIRAKIITFLRQYLDNLGFLEVCEINQNLPLAVDCKD